MCTTSHLIPVSASADQGNEEGDQIVLSAGGIAYFSLPLPSEKRTTFLTFTRT
jgi:hypothetical protein